MNRFANTLASIAAAVSLSATAHAALIDRGNGLIYDTVLDVTWMQDLNYLKTIEYDPIGTLYRDMAQMWVENLEYAGYSDWRLPSANLIGDYTPSTDGSTDVGTNNVRSELGYLFYVNLQNSTSGPLNFSFVDGLTGETKSFLNGDDVAYWLAEDGLYFNGMLFDFSNGMQFAPDIGDGRAFVLAVRDGDVATVPVPGAMWLFGSALVGLARYTRRAEK